MRKICILSGLLFFIFTGEVWAKRVLKVRGRKVYLSKKGLPTSKGSVLNIYADGYKVGKVKILGLLKGKFWIAKLVSGDVAKGDYAKLSRSAKRKRSKSRAGSRKGWHDGFYLGAGILKLDAPPESLFRGHNLVSLGYDKKITLFNKPFMWMLTGTMNMGGERVFLGSDETVETDDAIFATSFMQLNSDFAYLVNSMFYLKFGFGLTMLSYQAEFAAPLGVFEVGAYKESFMGPNGGVGVGAKIDLGDKFSLKLDLNYRLSYYVAASTEEPGEDPAEPVKGSQGQISALAYLGYKF